MHEKIIFHNSTKESISNELIANFDTTYSKKFFGNLDLRFTDIFANLGPIMVDLMDTMEWGKESPDIHEKSSRLFSIWGQNQDTNEVIVILRGFFVVVPFTIDESSIESYYEHSEELYYPIAQVSSIRTIYNEQEKLVSLISLIYKEINKTWKQLRNKIIKNLSSKSTLWKRFVASVDQVIQYSFVCHSMDRELIMAFKKQNYQTSTTYQVLSSLDASYDDAVLKSHISRTKNIIKGAEEDSN